MRRYVFEIGHTFKDTLLITTFKSAVYNLYSWKGFFKHILAVYLVSRA